MIVITGSAGFIGSHVASFFAKNSRLLLVDKPQHFRERGYIDPGTTSLWDWATGKEDRPSTHKVIDSAYFPPVLRAIGPVAPPDNPQAKEHLLLPRGDRIEWVIHLGACTNTAETRQDFLNEWNVEYTKSIWNWCTKHRVPLLYASSGATYGAGEQGFSDSWETALKLRPLNAYGQSKQDFDLWAHAEVQAGRAPPHWYGLKFFNVYGPHEAHKGRMASSVLHAFRHIQRHGTGQLFRSHNPAVKDGEQSRDFIHVDDIVKLCAFFHEKRPASGLYNCGTGQARTFHSLLEALFRALDKPLRVDWIDTPEQFRKAYQYFTEAEMAHALGAGYSAPFLSLEEGVASYVEWLLAHEKISSVRHVQ